MTPAPHVSTITNDFHVKLRRGLSLQVWHTADQLVSCPVEQTSWLDHLFSWSRSVFLVAQVSLPHTSYSLPFVVSARCFEVSTGRSCLNLPHATLCLLMIANVHLLPNQACPQSKRICPPLQAWYYQQGLQRWVGHQLAVLYLDILGKQSLGPASVQSLYHRSS